MSSKPHSETTPNCPRTDRKCPWGPYFNEPHWVEWNRKALADSGITAENPRGVCGAKVSPESLDTMPCAFLLRQAGAKRSQRFTSRVTVVRAPVEKAKA